MAEGGCEATGIDGLEMREDFDTPPESPDELKIELSPEVEAELEELQSTEDFITKNQESIARSAESVRELQATMEKLMGHTSARKSELESRTKKIRDMKREIEEISTEDIVKEEEALQQLAQMVKASSLTNGEGEAAAKPSENGDAAKPSENGDIVKVDRLTELKLKIESYKEHLGLQCNVANDCVEFVFTDIDSQSPNSSYSIKLCLEGEDYKCVCCEPEVKNVDDLFRQLNSHHDFHDFITSLRSAFQDLTNKEN